MGIAVIGSTFVDVKGMPLAPYIPAGRNMGRVETVHGGVCRNVAEDIANLGLNPSFISLIDDNGIGQDVVDRLESRGCDTTYMRRIKGGTGTWLAVFDNSGDVVASISYRPDLMPLADVFTEHGDEIFSQCDSVVIEIDMDERLVRQVLALADRWHKTVYAVVSNMSIALERRAFMERTGCVVCNQQEAGILFSENMMHLDPQEIELILPDRVRAANLKRMVVTMGGQGSVWVDSDGSHGVVPALRVDVMDTTGAGDSFFAGVTAGLTYGKSLQEACKIGTRLAASVIATTENVCPAYRREEFGF